MSERQPNGVYCPCCGQAVHQIKKAKPFLFIGGPWHAQWRIVEKPGDDVTYYDVNKDCNKPGILPKAKHYRHKIVDEGTEIYQHE